MQVEVPRASLRYQVNVFSQLCVQRHGREVLISAQDFEDFRQWQTQHAKPTLAQQFDEVRALLAARGEDGIDIPPRSNRANPMDEPGYWD